MGDLHTTKRDLFRPQVVPLEPTGDTKVTFRAERDAIHVQADLGGAARLGLFVMIFPLGLGVILAVVLSLATKPNAVIAPLLAVAPWLVLGPLMAHYIRKRTQKAIDALLQSAEAISQAGSPALARAEAATRQK